MVYNNSNLLESFKKFLLAKTLEIQDLKLEIFLIGEDLASLKYTEKKRNFGNQIGVQVNINKFPLNVSFEEVSQKLKQVKNKSDGIIFQLPVPKILNKLVAKTPLLSDVDFLGDFGDYLWKLGLLPPTVGAIDLVLKEILGLKNHSYFGDFVEYNLDLAGKTVCVIGQGVLVGGPLLKYLSLRKASIISVNSSTSDIKELTKKSDILICGAGRPDLIDKTWLNPKAIVIDASTSEAGGILVGDVKPESVYETNILCPSPGGIGKITVHYLFYNLTKLSEIKRSGYSFEI